MWTGPEYLEYLQDYVDAYRLSSFMGGSLTLGKLTLP